MLCKRCGRELMTGTKFCTGCGAAVEQNCQNCGTVIQEGMKFCVQCGFSFEQNNPYAGANLGLRNNAQEMAQEYDREIRIQRWFAILNTVIGALAIGSALLTDDSDLAMLLLFCGIGSLVVGILQLGNRSEQTIHINQIVFGALAVLCCFNGFGIAAGCPLVVAGILGILHKPIKISAIIETVFGGIILLFGFIALFLDGFGGLGMLFLGALNLTIGILKLTNLKHLKS